MDFKKFFIVLTGLIVFNNLVYADENHPLSPELTKARIKPVGKVNLASPTQAPIQIPVSQNRGQEIYTQYCSACHASGVGGAPKYGDEKAWAERMKHGQDHLLNSVKSGLSIMPPKGGCKECSDSDLKAAIDFIAHRDSASTLLKENHQ